MFGLIKTGRQVGICPVENVAQPRRINALNELVHFDFDFRGRQGRVQLVENHRDGLPFLLGHFAVRRLKIFWTFVYENSSSLQSL